MLKRALSLILLASAGTASAAGIGPEIAYVKDGARPEIYLVNRDGSGLRLVYRAPTRTRIFNLDMKPGGGEISFEQTACCSSGPTYFKTVQYAATGTLGTVSRSFSSCRISGIDYHPSDGSLLMSDTCNQKAMRLAAGSSTPVNVGVAGSIYNPRWLRDGLSFVYGNVGWLTRSSVTSPTTSTRLVLLELIADLDAGKASDQVLHAGDQKIDRIVLPSQLIRGIGQGVSVSFAPGDQEFIYVSPPVRGQSYLKIRRVDGSGAESRIGAAAAYTAVDWRN